MAGPTSTGPRPSAVTRVTRVTVGHPAPSQELMRTRDEMAVDPAIYKVVEDKEGTPSIMRLQG